MWSWITEHFAASDIAFARKTVSILLLLLLLGMFILVVYSSSKLQQVNIRKIMENVLLRASDRMQAKQGKYEEKRLFLSQMGINYRAGRIVSPEEFMVWKAAIAAAFGVLGCMFFGMVGSFLALAGFFIPDIYAKVSNNSDNEKILLDIRGIFDTIRIKTEGGMFLTSAIMECYKNTRNRRLKQALFEMNAQIIAKNDIRETVDVFNSKFKNKYIDTLCVILKQSLETGKTVEILQDISDQMADMQNAINTKTKRKMDAQIQTIQILLYMAIVGLCMYGVMQTLGDSTLSLGDL